MDYLGSSLAFPVIINETGSANLVEGVENVKNSVKRILTSYQKSEYYLRTSGSQINTLTFEPNDNILKGLLILFVIDSIEEQEPRVEVLEDLTEIQISSNIIELKVFCKIKNTNQTFIVETSLNRQV